MNEFVSSVTETVNTEDEAQKKIDGRDINVCIRARPLLDYEKTAGYFDTTKAFPQQFYLVEPKMNVRGQPIIEPMKNVVDYAFGAQDENERVH